jgi:hypothetical protein
MTYPGIFICSNCAAEFRSAPALQTHMRHKHNPHSRTLASERPVNRGPIPCGHPGCAHSFANERNAAQHRLHKHGVR